MNDLLFQIQQVSKSFHVATAEVPVLNNITFDVKTGEFLVIFGPSGCGKSTLLHTMLGLEEPAHGKVLFFGKNLYEGLTEDDRSDFRKQHAGIVYQQPNWIRSLTVVENVAFPLMLLGKERTSSIIKAAQTLRLVKMDKWANYFPTELSAGQQQKVALARALVTDPELIIADEPTGNLDYESGQELMQMLTELNKHGKTILMVTHDLNYISFANRAIRMFDGKLVDIYNENQKNDLVKTVEEKRNDGELTLTESNFLKSSIDSEDLYTTITRPVSYRQIRTAPAKKRVALLKFLVQAYETIIHRSRFILLLTLYLSNKLILTVCKKIRPWFDKMGVRFSTSCYSLHKKTLNLLDTSFGRSISQYDLIELAMRNMEVKKARMLVTIGGMTVGIGAIVFLVSLGYGLQQLVITRAARLEEMQQADVTQQTGGKIKIDDKTLAEFHNLPDIKMVLPLIAVVGRVSYKNSTSDMAVYGVTTDYLKQSAIKPVKGKIFDSNNIVSEIPYNALDSPDTSIGNDIIGVGEKIKKVYFTIDNSWIIVREYASSEAKILGYTKRTKNNSPGEELWGEKYESENESGKAAKLEDGEFLGKWIKASVLLWKKEKCDPQTNGDCDNGNYTIIRDKNNKQIQQEGYFTQTNLIVSDINAAQKRLLGVTTASSSAAELPDPSVDWVEIASESAAMAPPKTKKIKLATNTVKQAVVNRAMLKVLTINENDAVGKKFEVSFVVTGGLFKDTNEKIESVSSEYTIVGVTPEEKNPVFYVPLIHIKSLGITNYSQVKLVIKNQSQLASVRRKVEAMGYITRSVADTVKQINSLFATARTILMLLGMVALSVAALGMFNTLTVSLMERTREVGLMKAMGMKSSEVQELFLTESMIMGCFGGVLGIILGFLLGKLTGIILSFFSILNGLGFIDISYIPFSFIVLIIFLSFAVGIITGIYPAKRATKISALDALRYE